MNRTMEKEIEEKKEEERLKKIEQKHAEQAKIAVEIHANEDERLTR